MSQNTSKTYLRYKATPSATDYATLCDIKDYPDIFKAPEKIDTTTLSDEQHTYIKDIADVPDLTFTVNYDVDVYNTILPLEGTETAYEIAFGENGEFGKFDFTGDIFYNPNGGKVGAVREATITLYPSTQITPTLPTSSN